MQLKQFLEEWLAWAEEGIEPSFPTYPGCGLCWHALDADCYFELLDLLRDQFDNSGSPFNTSLDDYWAEPDKRLNPRRLAWVRETLKELSEC